MFIMVLRMLFGLTMIIPFEIKRLLCKHVRNQHGDNVWKGLRSNDLCVSCNRYFLDSFDKKKIYFVIKTYYWSVQSAISFAKLFPLNFFQGAIRGIIALVVQGHIWNFDPANLCPGNFPIITLFPGNFSIITLFQGILFWQISIPSISVK